MPEVGSTGIEIPPRGRADRGRPPRAAVVFERGSAGEAALREAAELASAGYELVVVALAPQGRSPLWGRAGGTGPYNIAIREEAALDLRQARDILGSLAGRAEFQVLAGCPPPLAAWALQRRIAVILLPRHRLTLGGNMYARSLRKKTSVEVRLVS